MQNQDRKCMSWMSWTWMSFALNDFDPDASHSSLQVHKTRMSSSVYHTERRHYLANFLLRNILSPCIAFTAG